MTFLNPAVLFGLLAAGIPVLLHLLNLRKLQRVEYSSVMFLLELQKSKIKRIKIKQYILLALRILLILLLVLSFARPTLQSNMFSGIASTAKTTSVLLLDNSKSMELVTSTGSSLNIAKEYIKKIYSGFNDGDNFYVLTSDGNIFNKENINSFNDYLSDLTASNVNYPLPELIDTATALLNSSDNLIKELILVGDFQNGYREKDLPAKIDSLENENIKVYTLATPEISVNNLSISEFNTETTIFEPGKEVTFKALVKNHSTLELNNNVVSLFLNGKRISRTSVDLTAGQAKFVQFTTTLETRGRLEFTAKLEDDDLNYDNNAYLFLNLPKKLKVAIITAEKGDELFIKTALENNSVISADVFPLDKYYSVDFYNYNTIFFVGFNSSVDINRITKSNNNKSIVIFPAENSNKSDLNRLLTGLGINGKLGNAFNLTENNRYVKFKSVNKEHPLFSTIFQDNAKAEINSPLVTKYFSFPASPVLQKLITLEDGNIFLAADEKSNTKVFVFSVAPTLKSGNFPLTGIFAPLVNRLVYYSGLTVESTDILIAGKGLNTEIQINGKELIKQISPSGKEVIREVNPTPGNTSLTFNNLNETGFYYLTADKDTLATFALNPNVGESDIALTGKPGEDKFISELSGETTVKQLNSETVNEEIKRARFGSELWRVFLILALLTAIIEMFVAKSSKKDIAGL